MWVHEGGDVEEARFQEARRGGGYQGEARPLERILAEGERAVVDRIVDGRLAVLLVGEEEREVTVPVQALPKGAREGTWVRMGAGDSGELVIDWEETEARRARLAEKLDLLRQRGRAPRP